MNAPLSPGTLVANRYRIVGLAGQGEFGLTYLAQDQKRFDELCILKEFTPLQQEPEGMELLRQCFHQQGAALYELQHSQLPRYRIMFIHEERLYLVREYIVGKSYGALLNERRTEGRAFSQAEVMQLLGQTLPVLTHLHRLGLVHENLSPQSLVVRREDQLVVLIELGLVKRLVARLQLHPVLPHTPIGYLGYSSPEQQQRGAITPGSDLYSLGAVAIALLLGKDPQEPPQRWIRASGWEAQTAIHPDFARILRRMLHPNPQKRFVSAAQVLRALEPIAPMVMYSSPPINRLPLPSPEAMAVAAPPAIAASQPAAPVASPAIAVAVAQPDRANPPAQSLRPLGDRRKKAVPRAKPRQTSAQQPQKSKADFRASAILVMSVALLVSVVSFRALSWVQTEPESPAATDAPTSNLPSLSPSPTAKPTSSAESASLPTPEPSPKSAEIDPVSLSSMRDRQKQLGVEMQFLSDLADEMFYAKHPDLQGQKLDDNQKDLQNQWTAIANESLSKLEGLSPEVRRKLGSYQRSDYDRWVAPESGASLNSRELNVLVNNRFAELFPDQKGKTLNPKTFGQVWYALAEEELGKLKPQSGG